MSRDFGIYIHWPYCAAKCPYCDFNSHVRSSIEEMRWANAIARELEFVAQIQKSSSPFQGEKKRRVTSIFFGGGTPSLMSGRATAAVLDSIAKLWPVAPDAEITLEANPNSVEQGRFADYRAAGVNRVSIGVQALSDVALKALGRLHGVQEAKDAVRLASRTFARVSFDLIYARPEQTLADWRTELAQALDFGTEHLSLYQLTIEPGTAYATLARHGRLTLPAEELAADFYELTGAMCEQAGLPAYEISNHARPGAECRHNLLYWRYGDYAGCGPGAHGRLTLSAGRVATEAERLPERWLARVEDQGNSVNVTAIDDADACREHVLMGLRLAEGLDLSRCRALWRWEPDPSRIAEFSQTGLVAMRGDRLAATARGRLVLNALVAELADRGG